MLTVIEGKPGSGKTCFCTSMLAKYLEDWVRYGIEKGERYPRRLLTNIPLRIEAINDYLTERIGERISVSDFVYQLEQTYFYRDGLDVKDLRKECRVKWWEKFEKGDFVVIDEVHQILGAESSRVDTEYHESFRDFISIHRHSMNDFIFITQHNRNIHKDILAMAEDCYKIINVKSKTLPLLGIPFADIDVVKESFGIKHQYANVLHGVYEGMAFRKDSTSSFLLRPEFFALYQSHTKVKEGKAFDRPSYNFTPFGSIIWFVRRHFWGVFIRALILIFVIYICYITVISMPKVFQGAFKAGISDDVMGTPKEKNVSVTKNENKSDSAVASPALPSPPVIPDDVITGYLRDGVICNKGIVRVGEILQHKGQPRMIESVDFKAGRVRFLGDTP
jgi:zona occludens toxin (predicted ATPase)